MEEKLYDVLILGGGPAGLSAAVYAARGGLSFILIEKNVMGGGQVITTSEVDNYLGLYHMNGFDMGMKFHEHALSLGTELVSEEIEELDIDGDVKVVKCSGGKEYRASNIVYALGAKPSKLNIPGEDEFRGIGVSYCATCDGNFFRNKTVAVVGGGDTALEDANYLANICEKVYLIHRRDNFRAAKSLQNRIFEHENVEVLWNSVVEEVKGVDKVERILVKNTVVDMAGDVNVDAIFIAIGTKPESALLDGKVDMTHDGHVDANEDCRTSVKGVYVAGDVRKKPLRQIITAASDGANAINSLLVDMIK